MIRNIVFDMGQVLLRFDPAYFIERAGAAEEDKDLLLREVYKSLEWARMDRGSLTEAEAAESMCRRLPERLHETVHALVDKWDRPHEYWPRVPASRFFDGTLVSADVKLVKPQPEIYRLLFETFSLEPDECVFIDDAINNAEGAFLCGMHPIVFHNDVDELRARLREEGVEV